MWGSWLGREAASRSVVEFPGTLLKTPGHWVHLWSCIKVRPGIIHLLSTYSMHLNRTYVLTGPLPPPPFFMDSPSASVPSCCRAFAYTLSWCVQFCAQAATVIHTNALCALVVHNNAYTFLRSIVRHTVVGEHNCFSKTTQPFPDVLKRKFAHMLVSHTEVFRRCKKTQY